MNIEDQVLAMPELSNMPAMPKMLADYLSILAPRLTLSPAVALTLEAVELPAQKLERVQAALETFPKDAAEFIRYIRAIRRMEKVNSERLEQVLPSYGADNGRNLAIMIDIYPKLMNKSFPWDEKNSRPMVDPTKVLNYATSIFATYEDSSRYAHLLFVGGLILDILKMSADRIVSEHRSTVVEYIEKVFVHSRRSLELFLVLSKQMKSMPSAEYGLAASFLHDIGKVVMAVLDPSYVIFIGNLERAKTPRSLCLYAEEKKYGISHPLLSYLVCDAFPILRPCAKALLYHHEPFILKTREPKALFDLAGTLSLSSNIVRTELKLPIDSAMRIKDRSKEDQAKTDKIAIETIKKMWMRTELDQHLLQPLEMYQVIQNHREGE